MAEKNQFSRGIVRRVMGYGAIVQLDDGTSGLVHISEIANRYVKDVRDYCKEGTPVVVHILRQKDDGRWEFSIKNARSDARARELNEAVAAEIAAMPEIEEGAEGEFDAEDFDSARPMYDGAAPHSPMPRAPMNPKKRAEFDEKLRDFLTDSSDHIEDVKRHHENRLGGKRR